MSYTAERLRELEFEIDVAEALSVPFLIVFVLAGLVAVFWAMRQRGVHRPARGQPTCAFQRMKDRPTLRAAAVAAMSS